MNRRAALTFFLSSIRKFSLWPKLVPDSSYRSLFHLYIIFFTTLFTRWMHRRLHRIHWQIWGKDVPGGLKRQVHLFNTTSTICKFLSLSLKDCTWLTRGFPYFCALRYTVHSIPKFLMFVWWMGVLLFGGYLGFSPSLQFNSVRGSAWRGGSITAPCSNSVMTFSYLSRRLFLLDFFVTNASICCLIQIAF